MRLNVIGAAETSLTGGGVSDVANISADFTIEGVAFNFSGSTLDQVVSSMQSSAPLNAQNVRVEKVGSNRICFKNKRLRS